MIFPKPCLVALNIASAIVLSSAPAHARRMDAGDFSQKTKFYRLIAFVEADGTSTAEEEVQLELLNQASTETFAHFQKNYEPFSGSVKVADAKTINGTDEVPVPADNIEDKPIASDSASGGFSEKHLVTISYPALRVGSRLYRKVQTTITRLAVPGFFESSYELWGLMDEATYHYRSKIPLYLETQDPEGYFQVDQRDLGPGVDYRYEIAIRLKHALVKGAIDEKFGLPPAEDNPRFFVSSQKTWKEAFTRYAEQWEAHFAREIPATAQLASFEPIRQAILETRGLSRTFDKINLVTSRINQLVRYAGDWRSTEKGFLPRPLAQVLAKKGGDCKDFTSLTVTALRLMGIKAFPAMVNRGDWAPVAPQEIPAWQFNHAITVAYIDGQEVWIDATNFTSFAQGKREDIENRIAVILDTAHARLGRIPAIMAQDGGTKLRRAYTIVPNNGVIQAKGSIEFLGRLADQVTGLQLRASKTAISDAVARAIFDASKMISGAIEPFDLTSRITKDATFNGAATVRNPVRRTTAGYAFPIAPVAEAERMAEMSDDRVSDLELFGARYLEDTIILEGATLVGTLTFRVRSKAPGMTVGFPCCRKHQAGSKSR